MAVRQAGRFVNACLVVWAIQATAITGCVIPEPISSLWPSTPASPTEAAASATWALDVPPATSGFISPADLITLPASSTAASTGLWETTGSLSTEDLITLPASSTAAPTGLWETTGSPSSPATSLASAFVTPTMASTPVVLATTSVRSSTISPTATLSPVGHFVEVGENHRERLGEGLFFPAQVDAERGDLIEFRIHGPYELYLSSLSRPCESTLPVLNERAVENASSVFNFVILDTDPIWFYTSRAEASESCGNQSVFAVNPGENEATFLTNADLGSGLRHKG
ncbi:Hypothetical protein PENO1_107360 [Penicillium occitanis (nom. inval.)]|nr:Hypothetical protein PENO1_107360 [Penicillium occitanis (nom. inval.)]PCG89149.1 hypothetical protein PENOC_107790 [Penicillium occitanis (nom. inval.)]